MAMTRGDLSAGDIQRAAHTIAATEGLEAVSMRRVADAVGVWPTALYHHVGDKQGLVTLVLDAVLAEVEIPDDRIPWDVWFRRLANSCRAVLLDHPGVAAHLVEHGNWSAAALQLVDRAVGVLRRDGFPDDGAGGFYVVFFTFVLSQTLREERLRERDHAAELARVTRPTEREPGLMPHLHAAAAAWRTTPPDAYLTEGVELLIAGASARWRVPTGEPPS